MEQQYVIMLVLAAFSSVFLYLDARFQYLTDKWELGGWKHFVLTAVHLASWMSVLSGVVVLCALMFQL